MRYVERMTNLVLTPYLLFVFQLSLSFFFLESAAFLTQTVQLDDATVKFEIWYV